MMTWLLIAAPLLMVLAAAAAAVLAYRWGYGDGQVDARGRHALVRLEQNPSR